MNNLRGQILEKIKRLERILYEIERVENSNSEPEVAIKLIKDEFRLESANLKEVVFQSYCWNLRETINDKLDDYLKEKKRGLVRGAPKEFRTFLKSFKNDVEDEILDLKRNFE